MGSGVVAEDSLVGVRPDNAEEQYVVVVSPEEWEKHRQRVELCITMLAAVMSALAASPFGGMIGPDIRKEIERVNNL